MSYGSEHVNGIIPQPIEKILKEKMHISKFRPQAASEYRAGAQPCKTMGPAKVPLNSPECFLKKNDHRVNGREADAVARSVKNGDAPKKKPPVPANAPFKCSEVLRPKTDFITKNALDVINAQPRMPTEKIVDDVAGQADEIECSGLVPKYTKKKNYGKLPSYICIRKEQRAAALQDYRNWIYEREALQQSVRILSEAERMELVEGRGLKKNWEESNVRYQGLSVITDTAPKKKRKQKIEAEMKQLERDIDMIESHKYIYVEQ